MSSEQERDVHLKLRTLGDRKGQQSAHHTLAFKPVQGEEVRMRKPAWPSLQGPLHP